MTNSTEETYFTVVFKVDDRTTFMPDMTKFTKAMMEDNVFPGATVTGCGWGDVLTEVDAYQTRLDELGENSRDVLERFLEEADSE